MLDSRKQEVEADLYSPVLVYKKIWRFQITMNDWRAAMMKIIDTSCLHIDQPGEFYIVSEPWLAYQLKFL